MFVQGNLTQTGNPLDIAIQGDGFIQIRQPNGEIGYTRAGDLKLSAEGYLCTAQGYLVEPGIVVPDGTQDMYIDGDGRVMATTVAGQLPEELGQMELARFINPAGLRSQGGNLYIQTEASGEPVIGTAGLDGFGEFKKSL
jgi:flagellar basal-body rod protein FlgG